MGKKQQTNPPFGIRTAVKKKPTSIPPDTLYQTKLSEKSQFEILNYVFCPKQFLKFWKRFEKNVEQKRAMRIMIQIGTIDALLRGKYFLSAEKSVQIDKKALLNSIQSAKMYSSDYKFSVYPPIKSKTQIKVVEGDCVDVALILKNKYQLNPIVLVMASRSHPGGGYRKGAAAQEESICRRSNLFQVLEDPYQQAKGRNWSYPLPEFGGVYSKDVIVLRSSEANGYAFLDKPATLSFVNVYAYASPPVETGKNGEVRLSKSITKHIKRKIEVMLNIGLENGHDCIVLSAFGCGVYANPPTHVAELFKEVIYSKDFVNRYRMIVFAILGDANSFKEHNPEGNIIPFAKVFECEKLDISQL